MDLKVKEKQELKSNNIERMIFCSYIEDVGKQKPYGSMSWDGYEWVIDFDSKNETIKQFHSTNVLANRILTVKDYDLYIPLVYTQSKSLYVKGLTKEFCEKNKELLKNTPLLQDENGYLLNIK